MEVVGPDGKEYEFPDGTSREQMVAFFKKRAAVSPTGVSFGDVAPPKRESTDSPDIEIRDLLQSIGQGITFGWGDEITSSMAAGLASLLQDSKYQDAYDDILEEQRKQGKKFVENYPGIDFGLQVAGGLMTGKAPLQVVRGFGNQVAKVTPQAVKGLATQIPRATGLAKTAAESAALGAVAGAGYTEGDTTEGALSGAATGAAFGAAVPTVIAAGRKMAGIGKTALDVLANSMGLGSGDSVARKRLRQAIERDGMSPEDLLTRLKQDEGMGYPVSLIDIAGPNVKNLAERVVKRSGPAYAPLLEKHKQRLEEIPERAKSSLDADLVLSNPSSKAFLEWNKSLGKQEDLINKDLAYYFATDKRPMPDIVKDKFENLIEKDGDFAQATRVAKELLKGRKDINFGADEFGLGTLYYTKRGLDSMIETGRKAGFDPEVKNRLIEKSKAIDGLLREMSGDYGAKADTLTDLARKKDLLQMGTKIQDEKFTPDAMRDFLRNIKDEDDLSLFLSGVREGSLNRFGKDVGNIPMSDLVFGRPATTLREKMDMVYRLDPESYGLMKDRVAKYDTMMNTSRTIPGLSTTNTLSSVIDPESRDVSVAMGASGLSGILGSKSLAAPLATYAASRLIPAQAAQNISRAVYGDIPEAERMLAPLMKSPLRQLAERQAGRLGGLGVAQKTYGILPQYLMQEPDLGSEFGPE